MKTAVIPQIRVEPELRAELESVLRQGEALTECVETTVQRRLAITPFGFRKAAQNPAR
ncbi:MAG: YlcI/YnfO family protein [bacterium]